MKNSFGTTSSYTVGVEEEFQLVAPSTLQLAPAVEEVIGAIPDVSERLARELFQDCVEMRTPVFSTVAELAQELPALRRMVAEAANKAGVGIAAAGLHPISDPFSQSFTRGERYERMKEELGALARLQIIYALHVHVGVPDAEAAIRATNALLRHVPLFVALSANSPFWNRMDTGFATARVKIRDASPARGSLRPSVAGRSSRITRTPSSPWGTSGTSPGSGGTCDPTRAHGTVELRVPEAQATPDYAVALAALAQCLVATADDYAPEDARFVSENKWRAIRRDLVALFRTLPN